MADAIELILEDRREDALQGIPPANGSFPVFLTTSRIVFRKVIFTSLLWLGQVIGANEPVVVNRRVEKDAADHASQPNRYPVQHTRIHAMATAVGAS